MLLICTKFHENIFDGIKGLEQKKFSLKIFQRGIISQKSVGEITVLVFCTLSDTSFYAVS